MSNNSDYESCGYASLTRSKKAIIIKNKADDEVYFLTLSQFKEVLNGDRDFAILRRPKKEEEEKESEEEDELFEE